MKSIHRRILALSMAAAAAVVLAVPAGAMHIMEGYLPAGHCIAWGVVCLPFVILGLGRIRKVVSAHRKTLLLLAMAGAYTFLLSALKIPSVSGSSSHPTGTGLGANTFSMAIAGPFVSWGVWALCRKANVNKRVSVFLAAALGDLLTYVVTSVQLALAHPAPTGGFAAAAVQFLGVFAVTQVPLAIVEGLLTVAVIVGLESLAQPELRELGYAGGAA